MGYISVKCRKNGITRASKVMPGGAL